jgi:hypothetical protein
MLNTKQSINQSLVMCVLYCTYSVSASEMRGGLSWEGHFVTFNISVHMKFSLKKGVPIDRGALWLEPPDKSGTTVSCYITFHYKYLNLSTPFTIA